MRALQLRNRQVCLAEVPTPEPPPGEALVRVRLAGICHTDLELARGYMGFAGTLGHEFVGEVAALPAAARPSAGLAVGQRVVGEINASCQQCAACRAGLGRHCPRRTVLGILARDGAFADYLTLPLGNLWPVPPEIPDAAAVFVEPLAAALEILEQVAVRPTERVVVLGDGKLGQLVARVLHLVGAEVLVVGRHPAKLALLEAAGIAARLDPPAERADIVVECTGRAAGLAQAMRLVRPRGTLVLKSTVAVDPQAGAAPLDLAPLVVDEITVVGSRCGPFGPALRLLAEHRLDVTPLISAEYRLVEGVAAFAHAGQRGTLKVLLRP